MPDAVSACLDCETGSVGSTMASPASGEATGSSWSDWYTKAASAPCFREPLLWGLGCGFLAGLHKYRIHHKAPRAVLLACDFAVLGMGVSTSLAWYMCMRDRRKEEMELRQILAVQGFKHMSELPSEGEDGESSSDASKK